jgi:Flp pilus assembly protein CpaB
VGPGLLLGASGLIEAPVRVADGATVALVRPGDRVDILAAPGADTEDASTAYPPTAYPPTADQPAAGGLAQAQLVAEAAQVLAIPLTSADEASSGGALLVLAVSPTTSRILAAAAASERLSLVIR